MKNANPLSSALVAVLALGLAACRDQAPAAPAASKTVADHFDVGVDGQTVHLQVAVLPVEQERGLMKRRDLGPDEGMIFVDAVPHQMTFWMHDTPIPLDIGYFTADGALAEIYPMYPYDERTVASRSGHLQFALEMNQGWFARHHLAPGARLDLRALRAALRARGFDPKRLGLPE